MRIETIDEGIQRQILSRAVSGPESLSARQIEPYRWRLSGSTIAHLFKATTRQHHQELAAIIARLVPREAVVFDVGAHAGQYTKLFASTAAEGRVYAVEPGSYARSILRTVVWSHRLGNVAVLPMGLGATPGLATLTMPVKGRGSFGFGLAHLGAPGERWRKVAQELVALTTLDTVVAALGLDRVDDAFAFLEGLDYAALEFAPGGGLIPVATRHDGDFWFIPREDPGV